MAFLFKSKKNLEKAPAQSKEGPNGVPGTQSNIPGANGRPSREEKGANTPGSSVNNSLNSLGGTTPSPDQNVGRRGPSGEHVSDLPFRNTAPAVQPVSSTPNASLYPWSQRRLTYTSSHPSPFPRYGAAVNSIASKEGDIYLMGGLINSSTVKGDLWMVEAGSENMACYPLATTQEGPGPRVGHASLLVGNAFIVYGGDTKMDDSDVLDETLYLLNTSTRQWSRAVPAGPRPSGRYGHSLNILGSKIYIFGGQVEGYFMNDLCAFDLNQLQLPTNRWEFLIRNSDDGGPPKGKVPPPRTNHSMVTYGDKLYLFGGTNGFQWFNDVWSYDPITNLWLELDCIGYIPAPREGHAAALVDDVMYIFGGRTEEGADLGDLAAFRLTTRRWYTFQNMGPSPSPRSGHSMTSYGKQIIVLAGEPSSAGREANDLAIVYVLDTTKIRYPNDGAQQATAGDRIPGKVRRPSGGEQAGMGPPRNIASRDGSIGPEQRRLNGPGRESVLGQQSLFARPNGQPGVNGNDANGVAPGSAQAQGPQGPVSKLPRASLMQALSGPPPQQQAPSRPNGNAPATNPPPRGKPPSRPDRGFGPALDTQRAQSPAQTKRTMSPAGRDSPSAKDSPNLDGRSPNLNGRRTPTGQTIRNVSSEVAEDVPTVENQTQGPMRSGSKTKHGREKGSTDSSNETGFRSVVGRPSSPPPPQRQSSNSMSRKNSTRSSQSVALLKELEAAKNRNAWYASELELAKKAGYVPNPSSSPLLDQKGAETFGENDKPLIEALITMRNELANVQASIDQQAVIAAKKIAEVEKQRDTAINEAIYAKAKLAAHGGSANSTPQLDSEARDLGIVTTERHEDISRKLATALATQKGLQQEVDMLTAELEGEKRGRQLAEETANAAQERLTDLETYKQQNSSEVERLKAELHQVHKEAREVSAAHTEAMTKVQLLQISKDELETRHKDVVESSKGHSDTFDYLREAMAASTETQKLLERKLEEERSQREKVEEKLRKLRAEHEEATVELENASRRLRDAEEMAEKHALEAKTHRQAVEAGLDRATSRDITSSFPVVSDKSATLQAQVEATNALVRKYQAAADTASEKLRGAEGRIAGLEVYQEQVSREGLSIRKQLQAALRETQSLQAANADLKHQLANQQLEANAANVQHNTLKDLLGERGISPVNAATRSRGIASPQNREGSPDQARIRELEQQLQAITQAHEESKQSFETREQEAESSYREKLAQLEQDYQAAVHYIKGTEKMLKKMKDELTKHKHENTRMKSELEEMNEKLSASAAANAAAAETSKEAAPQPPADWEHERSELSKQVDNLKYELNRSQTQLQAQLDVVRRELESSNQERERFRSGHEDSQRQFSETVQQARQELDQLQAENQLLERRALDAEQKVSLLLDQVETSVDNYRRQSRQAMGGVLTPSLGGSGGGGGAAPHGHGHSRNLSAQSNDAEGSVYSVQPPPIGADARNSMALDSLASELETLRSHWETTNKNYRISNTFDFERPRRISEEGYGAGGGGEISKEQNEQREAGTGRVLLSPTTMQGGTSGSPPKSPGLELSSSLADWRKRLEGKEEEARRSGSALSTGSGSGGRKGSLLGVEVEEKGAEGKHGL